MRKGEKETRRLGVPELGGVAALVQPLHDDLIVGPHPGYVDLGALDDLLHGARGGVQVVKVLAVKGPKLQEEEEGALACVCLFVLGFIKGWDLSRSISLSVCLPLSLSIYQCLSILPMYLS